MALFVEALLMRTPRRLWDLKTGLPAPDSDIREALSICERSMAISKSAGLDPHPAIPHLHIHALEMSTEPERAMFVGRRAFNALSRFRAHEPHARSYLCFMRPIRAG